MRSAPAQPTGRPERHEGKGRQTKAAFSGKEGGKTAQQLEGEEPAAFAPVLVDEPKALGQMRARGYHNCWGAFESEMRAVIAGTHEQAFGELESFVKYTKDNDKNR